MTARSHDDLADRLDAIAEDIAERAIDMLREAMSDGASKPPREERTLTQARRAVEKAAHLLRSGGHVATDSEDHP